MGHKLTATQIDGLTRKVRSPFNAPNVGEFNNAKVTPFIEPDPTLKRRFKKGLIVIDTTTRIKKGNHRNFYHMHTKFDCRNDPAWHIKNVQKFSLAAIIATGTEMAEVETLDELQLTDKNGESVTHDFLTAHLGYLNGDTMIHGFTPMTTMQRINQGQRSISNLRDKMNNLGIAARFATREDEARERRKILDTVDKQMLQV